MIFVNLKVGDHDAYVVFPCYIQWTAIGVDIKEIKELNLQISPAFQVPHLVNTEAQQAVIEFIKWVSTIGQR